MTFITLPVATLLIDFAKDKLVGISPGIAIKSIGSLFTLLISFHIFIPGPTSISNIQVIRLTNENIQKATKLILKLFFQGQKHTQNQAGLI